MLAIIERFSNKEEVKNALKVITSWSVRNLSTGVIGTGTLEKEFSSQAKLINDGNIRNSAELRKSIQSLIPTDEQFKNAFKIATVSKAYIARYYLRKLEESYRTTQELSPLTNPDKVNLEHVLPENPTNLKEDWQTFDENTHRSYCKRLGNLTILNTIINREIGCGDFNLKKEKYEHSEIIITKSLSELDKWDWEEIEKRQNEFAERALKIWGI